MNLSNFLFRVIILALPGLTASQLYRKLRGKPSQKDWEDFIEIWYFFLICYCVYGAVAEIINKLFGASLSFTVLQALFDERTPIRWREVLATTLLSIVVAFVATYINSRRLLNKIGQKVRATTRYDDSDVWECFNDEFKSKWVFVRDHKLNLLYYGWIDLYSDSEKPRELSLRDVKVYNNLTGEHLYSCDSLYIAREKSELSIEIPSLREKISGEEDSDAAKQIEQCSEHQ